MGGHLIEQRARLLGGDAGGDDADVDTALVHGDEQVLQRGGGGEVAAEQLGDALVAGLAQEGRGGLAGQRVDPEVDDRHAGSAAPAAGVGFWPAAFASAFALAARR